eukprot:4872813-Alexandrium_andersonii.AAC.1
MGASLLRREPAPARPCGCRVGPRRGPSPASACCGASPAPQRAARGGPGRWGHRVATRKRAGPSPGGGRAAAGLAE